MFILLAFLSSLSGSISSPPATTVFARDVLPPVAEALACVCPERGRDVTNIVYSCLATIFACAWVAVHPNIPAPEELPDGNKIPQTDDSNIHEIQWRHPAHRTWERKYRLQAILELWRSAPERLKDMRSAIISRCYRALPRLELMAWTLLAPECMVFWAMRQWYGAHVIQKEMEGLYPNWTKTHGHFLQMGGFVLFDGNTRMRILDLRNLRSLLREKEIQDFRLTQADIEDHSKGDGLSKAVVLGQTIWFVAQCISRKVTNLATTELELVTLAVATLNGLMYFFWWDKPLDVRNPVHVYLRSDLDPTQKRKVMEYLSLLDPHHSLNSKTPPVQTYQWLAYVMKAVCQRLDDMCIIFTSPESEKIRPEATKVHIFYAQPLGFVQAEVMQGMSIIIAAMFGGIHCAAWNFTFASKPETILWRVSCSSVTAAPLLLGMHMWFYKPEDKWLPPAEPDEMPRTLQLVIWFATVYILLPLYFLARIILLLVAVLSLRDLPSSALTVVQWSTLLPHI